MIARLGELAEWVQGRVVGDSDTEIIDALPLQDAQPHCLTLAASPQQATRAGSSVAAAVLLADPVPDFPKPMLIVDDLHDALTTIIERLRPPTQHVTFTGVDAAARVDSTARIGVSCRIAPGAYIGPNCVLGDRITLHPGVSLLSNCTLGDDCELFPNVTLYSGTRLGQRVLVHANAVLGAYGFGYRQRAGRHVRSAQLGWVEIGDDVEIGAGTTVDRGSYGATRVGCGSKLDNQVQIGHNCQIGKHNLICAQVGIAGSTSTGDCVVLAGQAGVADHLHLADNVTVGAQAGVMCNLESGAVVVGSPSGDRRQKFLEWAISARLPEMRQALRDLQSRLAELEQSASPLRRTA